MKETNILDAKEQAPSFLYNRRSFYCFVGNILNLILMILIAFCIDEDSIKVGFFEFLGLFLLAVMGLLTILGCYYSIQSLRLKEAKPWRAVLSLFLHLGLVLLPFFSLTTVSTSTEITPSTIPIAE